MAPEEALDFRALFHAVPGAAVVLRPDAPHFTILAASDAYLRAAMLEADELVGRPLFEAMPDANPGNPEPTGERNVRASLDTVLRTRAPHRMEIQRYDAQGPDGTWKEYYWEPLNTPVLGPDGEVRYILQTVQNVTTRIRAERAATTAERQLQMAFLQAPALVALTEGPEHRFVLANPGFEEIVGRGDLVGRTVREALPELEAQGIFAPFDRVYATGEAYVANEQRILLSRDGGHPYEGWYNIVYQPLTDSTGAVTGILQHVVEVTAQVRARERAEAARGEAEQTAAALAQIESRLRFALAVAELGAWELDLATQRAWRDPRHDQIFGYDAPLPEWTYEMFLAHVVPEDRERVAGSFWAALETRTPWDFTCRIRRADGAERWIVARGEPVTDAAGKPVRLVGIVRDVTAEREAEAALRRAKQEAEAANRAKSEFLAVMSHELRTPLNAISGYADILEMGIHGPVTEAQRQALGRIQKSQQHLLGLINEVLNYARLESGAVRYDIEDVHVREAFVAAESLITPQTRAQEITLTVGDCPADLAVRADPEKLRQILVNLLSNAVKFTDAGGRIDLGCEVRTEQVHLLVRDTGVGIPPDKLEWIFEPFVQVRADLTRTAEGTGLGLAISRDLARGMDGDLLVESTLGAGSTFTLTLPRAS